MTIREERGSPRPRFPQPGTPGWSDLGVGRAVNRERLLQALAGLHRHGALLDEQLGRTGGDGDHWRRRPRPQTCQPRRRVAAGADAEEQHVGVGGAVGDGRRPMQASGGDVAGEPSRCGSKKGVRPAARASSLRGSLSTQSTSWPISAKQAPATRPTWPAPMTQSFTELFLRTTFSPQHTPVGSVGESAKGTRRRHALAWDVVLLGKAARRGQGIPPEKEASPTRSRRNRATRRRRLCM